MSFFQRYGFTLLILVVCGGLAVVARIFLGFNMVLVSATEVMLYGAAAAAFVWAADREATEAPVRRANLIMATVFGLAALRSGIWAGFGDVVLANTSALGGGLLVLLGAWIYRRRQVASDGART